MADTARAIVRRRAVVTTATALDDVDFFVRLAGIGTFSDAVVGTQKLGVDGRELRCLSIVQLMAAKRAAGRAEDLAHIAALGALQRLDQLAPATREKAE